MRFIIIIFFLVIIITSLWLYNYFKSKNKFSYVDHYTPYTQPISGIKFNTEPINEFQISSENKKGKIAGSGNSVEIDMESGNFFYQYNPTRPSLKLCYIWDEDPYDMTSLINKKEKTSNNCYRNDTCPGRNINGQVVTDIMACSLDYKTFNDGNGWKILPNTTLKLTDKCGGAPLVGDDYLYQSTCAQQLYYIKFPAWTCGVLFSSEVMNTINGGKYKYALIVCNATSESSTDLITIDLLRKELGSTSQFKTFQPGDVDYMFWNDSISRNNDIPYQQKRSFNIQSLLKGNSQVNIITSQKSLYIGNIQFAGTNVSTKPEFNITNTQTATVKNVFFNPPEDANSSYFNFALKWNNDIEFNKVIISKDNIDATLWNQPVFRDNPTIYGPYPNRTWDQVLSIIGIRNMLSIYDLFTYLQRDIVIPDFPSYYFNADEYIDTHGNTKEKYLFDRKYYSDGTDPTFSPELQKQIFKKIYDSPAVQKSYFNYINNTPNILLFMNSSITFNTNIITENIIEGNINDYYPPKPDTEKSNYSKIRENAKSLNIFIQDLADFYYNPDTNNIRPALLNLPFSFPALKEEFIDLYFNKVFTIDSQSKTETEINNYASEIYNAFGESSLVQNFNLNFYPENSVNNFIDKTNFSDTLIYQKILNGSNFFDISPVLLHINLDSDYIFVPMLNLYKVSDITNIQNTIYFKSNGTVLKTENFGETITIASNMPTQVRYITNPNLSNIFFMQLSKVLSYPQKSNYNIKFINIDNNTYICWIKSSLDTNENFNMIYKVIKKNGTVDKIKFYENGQIDLTLNDNFHIISNKLNNIQNPTSSEFYLGGNNIYLSPTTQNYILKYENNSLKLYQNIFYSEGFLKYLTSKNQNFSNFNTAYFNYCKEVTEDFKDQGNGNYLTDNRCFCVLKDQSLKSNKEYAIALDLYFKKMLNTNDESIKNKLSDNNSIFCIDGNCVYNNPIMKYQFQNGTLYCNQTQVICNSIIEVIDSTDINENVKIACTVKCNDCKKDEICGEDAVCYKKCTVTDNSPCKIKDGIYYSCISGMCKNCTDSNMCATGFTCENGLCKKSCVEDSNCTGINKKCFSGICRECSKDNDCNGKKCNTYGECVECINNPDCKDGLKCYSGKCYECVSNENCPISQICSENKCKNIYEVKSEYKESKTESVELGGFKFNANIILMIILIIFLIVLFIVIIK